VIDARRGNVNDKNYTITLYTLNNICEARNLKLSDFF
jgi:DNA-binding Xre family transcriptional regulator